MRKRAYLTGLAAVGLAGGLAGCGPGTMQPALPSANPSRGKQLIGYFGCGACHVIGGISTANGHVGPPLTNFSTRYNQIAGVMPNTPRNVVRWIQDPERFVPNVDMPDLGVGKQGAQDIAAYLYGQ